MEDEVRLAVPATAEFLRLGRVTASGLASRLGFTYDEIDDLRLAIDELCSSLIAHGSGEGTVELRYGVSHDALRVSGVATFADTTIKAQINEWSTKILDALVDEHSIVESDRGPSFLLVKRRASSS